jgi:hypothetical protein
LHFDTPIKVKERKEEPLPKGKRGDSEGLLLGEKDYEVRTSTPRATG